MRRLRRTDEDAEAGVSLVELMVSISITAVALAMIGTMFMQVMNATSDGQKTKTASQVASTVVDEVTRVVRQGVVVPVDSSSTEGAVIAGSTSTSLTIDANVDATVTPSSATIPPTRVTLSVNSSGYLIEQRTSATVSGGYYQFGSTSTTRSVNGPILTSGTGSSALFVYLDAGGSQVVPGASGLSATQAASVRAVTVNVVVANTLSTGSSPVQLSNTVTMPNVAISNGGS